MNTDYFPKQLYLQLEGSFDYFCGAYKAASHNFTVSTEFEHLSSSNITSEVADGVFSQNTEGPSFDLKAKHFISHVLVGTLLLVPILNIFVFMGFESQDEMTVNVPILQNKPLDISTVHTNMSVIDLQGNDSPEEPTPIEIPKPQSRVVLGDSPHMDRLKRRNSKVSQRALFLSKIN